MKPKSLLSFLMSALLLLTFLVAFPWFTATAQGNWWDKFGKPQYGGNMVLTANTLDANFDLTFFGGNGLYFQAPLFMPDWTLDRNIWPMNGSFTPDQYFKGVIAENWEMTDPQTLTVHIRKGVTWQNKPPVNGREFTAYDIQYHFKRQMDPKTGSIFAGMMSNWDNVTAIDKYTVVFKFKTPCSGTAFQSVQDLSNNFEAPEAVEAEGGKLIDWTKGVGAGPWMIKDFTTGSSMTLVKNPTYWGYDPRYPQNRLPYADSLTILCIPDSATALAALRTAKIDLLSDVDWKQAKVLEGSNPELQKTPGTPGTGAGVCFRLDKEPFTNINVRKALNMSVDRKAISRGLYGGNTDGNAIGWFSQTFKGYCYAYADWPQSLKDEYNYNPAAAKKLLADAGYPDGFNTNVVSVPIPTSAARFQTPLDVLEAFKSYFKDIGVNMEIKAMDQIALETFLRAGKHDQMFGQGGNAPFPPTRAIDQWYSKGSDAGKTKVNDTTYEAIRAKFWAAATAAEAAQACMEADKRVIEQHWGVWIETPDFYNFCQPYLKGFSGEPRVASTSTSMYLWIDSKLKK